MKIELSELGKRYRDADKELVVISNLTYTFDLTDSMAIVGRSGVGKSTLLHLMGGLDRATSGMVLYDALDIAQLSDKDLTLFRGQNIGFIFQFHHLLPDFNALENVAMPLTIRGISGTQVKTRAEEALRLVGLGERLLHRPGELSGGEQQRVAIARAIVTKPKVVLADEPTGNLDVQTAEDVTALLHRIHKEEGVGVIVATHSSDLARSLKIRVEMSPGGKLRVL